MSLKLAGSSITLTKIILKEHLINSSTDAHGLRKI